MMKASDFKYTATTPKTITEAIRQFCHELSSQEPVFLEVQPDTFAAVGMCYLNTAQVAESIGGQVVFGWLIWELNGIYATAEHHAVVETDGKLIDVTPQFAGERTVLFVPDRITGFSLPRPANKYVSLVKNSLIQQYVEIARRNAAIDVAGKAFGYEYSQNDRQMTRLLDLYISRLRDHSDPKANRKKKKEERNRKKQGRRNK